MKTSKERLRGSLFPDDFLWGSATASYQVEGGAAEGGRAPSVWDMFCRWKGKVNPGHSGDVACDHYHRYREDMRLAAEIGVKGYRFSFSWSRVIPEGVGPANEAGLDFYDRLIDAMLEEGIEPFPTLFHWDYPYALFLKGGWLHPDSPKWFEDYTKLLVDRYSDRVSKWFTLNEPSCFLGLGHVSGEHAPGLKLDMPEFFVATKHALMAHGLAARTIKARSKTPAHVSIAPVASVAAPATESDADIAAAREACFGATASRLGYWHPRIYLDPIAQGTWPEEIEHAISSAPIRVTPEELETMHGPLDSIGLNYYSCPYVKAGPDGAPVELPHLPGHARSAFDWPVVPEGLYWAARFHYERYGLPMFVTENGMSSVDWVALDGRVHDPQRIDYTERHLIEVLRAISEGIPVGGYYHWSLLDNFEWAEGYRHRFGLIHVDYQSLERTIKDSGYWYKEVSATNGANLFEREVATV